MGGSRERIIVVQCLRDDVVLSTPAFVRPDEWRDQWISKRYSCGC